jgi:hypothetical protein
MDPVEPVSRRRPAVAPIPPLRPPARRRPGERDERDRDEAETDAGGPAEGDDGGDDGRPHVDVLA